MPIPIITIGELQALHNKKKKGRRESFERILERCHNRMRSVAKHNALNCFFEIPTMIMGLPLYDMAECTEYILTSLRRAGFLVQLVQNAPGTIYISWDPAELNPRKRIAVPTPAPAPPPPIPMPLNARFGILPPLF